MRAHRLKATVPENHEVTVRLPSDSPTGDVEVIVLEARHDAPGGRGPGGRLTVDELIAGRLRLPPDIAPVTLEDIDRAIVEGAVGRGDV